MMDDLSSDSVSCRRPLPKSLPLNSVGYSHRMQSSKLDEIEIDGIAGSPPCPVVSDSCFGLKGKTDQRVGELGTPSRALAVFRVPR